MLIILSQILGNGGIPRFNRNLVSALKNKHSNVVVISLNDESTKDFYGASKNKVKFIFFILLNFLKKRPSKIIFGHIRYASLVTITSFLNIESYMIIHGIEAWESHPDKKKYFKKINLFLAVSNYTKRKFAEKNNVDSSKIIKIFNTIPINWSNLNRFKYDPFFLTVTRLEKTEGYKGVDLVIEGVIRLKDKLRNNNFKYYVVANGNDVERHKTLVKENNVEDLVVFLSNVTDEHLKKLYSECMFFILPSTGEGFGIVFLEAMAFSKACVGSLNCGTEDVIINNETGFLIKPNIDNVVEVIDKFIDNPLLAKKMGIAGAQFLMNNFTFNHFSDRINSIIKK